MVFKDLKKILNPEILIKNSWLAGILIIFLVMYGPRLQPNLPTGLKALFNNPLFRGTILFLIIYISQRDIASALVITIIFVVTVNLLHSNDVFNKILIKQTNKKDDESLLQLIISYLKKIIKQTMKYCLLVTKHYSHFTANIVSKSCDLAIKTDFGAGNLENVENS